MYRATPCWVRRWVHRLRVCGNPWPPARVCSLHEGAEPHQPRSADAGMPGCVLPGLGAQLPTGPPQSPVHLSGGVRLLSPSHVHVGRDTRYWLTLVWQAQWLKYLITMNTIISAAHHIYQGNVFWLLALTRWLAQLWHLKIKAGSLSTTYHNSHTWVYSLPVKLYFISLIIFYVDANWLW